MYLLTYLKDDVINVGFLNKDKTGIVPARLIFSKFNLPEPNNMIELIEHFDELNIEKIDHLLENTVAVTELSKIKILAPIPYPKRNVLCLGKNYLDHVKEVKSLKNVSSDVPTKPIYFSKIASPAIGHEDYVDSHESIVKQLDYEVELAVIIGKKCKNVAKENVKDCIFGYTIANDISARDIQTDHVQWHKGKSFDTFCPLGPYIAHKSLISFPPSLEIKSYVNGELRQNSNTNNLIFDIETIISDLTTGVTLLPGDIVLTGTPAGVGAGFNPPKYMKNGDRVDCVIENIGTLTNFIK